jgi:alkylation response protein AidB-like acyl-CoA dehydrogenase
MDFNLKDEQLMIQQTARDFAKKELEPVAAKLDKTKDFSLLVGNIKKLAGLGFMGLAVPERYGGAQAGTVAFSLALTEIGKVCASTAVTMSVTNMVAELLVECGTEQQKQKYVPKILSGEYAAGSFALTESSAGSDPTAMKTVAVENENGYLLNGSKLFITSAEYAGIFVVWAITDKQARRGKGISVFIVEQGTPGCSIGKNEEKMGQRGSVTNELHFENCQIPKENLLGELNDGYRIALTELSGGRIGVGSMALGIGLAAMDFATNYAKERIQFGKPISSFQALQWMIADSYTELEAARLLLLRAAFLKETGQQFAREAAMGKLYATEAANRACSKGIQMLGGYGYLEDYPLERYYRDARITTIYEGTSEIQRLLIARSFLNN